ncbi:MAG: hypothetical protein K2Y20_08950 [Sphingomonas sp.]|nr:hypothetical protein [Sphingomonas sp.]
MLISMLLAFASVSEFLLVDRRDEITGDRQIVYLAESDRNVLAIGCQNADRNELFVRLVPADYYGPSPRKFLWEPNAVYRFGDGKANKDKWIFGDKSIELGDLFGEINAKAKFINDLSRNTVLYIRYEEEEGESKTVSFLYRISKEQLSFVIRTCNPKKVRALLRERGTDLQIDPTTDAK